MIQSDEIESISLHNNRPLYLHLNLVPFFVAYLTWFYVWTSEYGLSEFPELGMIVTACIALAQVLTCLFCYWFVDVRVLLSCSRQKDPFKAELVKVKPKENNGYTQLVKLNHKLIETSDGTFTKQLWFIFQKTKYIYDSEEKKQFKSIDFPINNQLSHYNDAKGYQNDSQISDATSNYGLNQIIMDIPKFIELFIERATAPFFVFQVFCVLLWCLDEYWYYSVFTLIMLVSFECTLVQQQLKNMQMIRQMGNKSYKIMVYRSRKWTKILTDELLPGDICSVTRSTNGDMALPCDMILLRGQCIVNESMLTGESVPVLKEPLESRHDTNASFDIQQDGKLHMLYGGTQIVQHTPPPKNDSGLKSQDNGCVAYVLRTGFNTSQGKLLRTILYSVKQVTANNLETFLFILFLLIFAIAASAYVWIEGSKDPSRNRYKLLLECTLILTSVIPPELPIELALAVNTSLIALVKLGIYCTEPFRIPFAGKVDICCFDKTGTLTSDDLIVEGIAGIDNKPETLKINEIPNETLNVLATCHTLVNLDDELIGDPLEKETLQAIEWLVTKGEAVVPKRPAKGVNGWKIFARYHFSSTLKRMSVIAGYTKSTNDVQYIATCKGAPEVLKSMLREVPSNYDEIYLRYAREGARVLSLGCKELGTMSSQQLRELNRDEIESNLKFCGFLIISCPLKPDSKAVIKEIMESSHHAIIITGDNPLTGCHVGSQLNFINKNETLLLKSDGIKWFWSTLDDLKRFQVDFNREIHLNYDYCLTGDGFDYLNETNVDYLKALIRRVKVFARVSPKQKELVVIMLNSLGYFTLMCGDGTNDVGALKHAHVGVALLSNSDYEKKKQEKTKEIQSIVKPPTQLQVTQTTTSATQKRLQEALKELEELEQSHVVKLGDASIASPFTFKQSSIQCVCHIIKQGRCTLVTTLQMFKILALNALIMAYSQSVLYLDGIKLSDGQATMQGLLLAGCFLFISRSKPLKILSRERPLANIFNLYTILTVLLQFSVHMCALIFLTNEAHARMPQRDSEFVDLSAEFKPSLLNTTVYIISLSLQVATFAINYKGRPFMESLRENKALLYSILFSAGAVFVLANHLSLETCEQFQIVELPDEFRTQLITVILGDLVVAFAIDRLLARLFGEARLKAI